MWAFQEKFLLIAAVLSFVVHTKQDKRKAAGWLKEQEKIAAINSVMHREGPFFIFIT